MTGYGLHGLQIDKDTGAMDDFGFAQYTDFWSRAPGYDADYPDNSDVFSPRPHRRPRRTSRPKRERQPPPRIYRDLQPGPPSQIQRTPSATDNTAVVPSPTQHRTANNYHTNETQSPLLRMLSSSLLIAIMQHLGPASLLIARQVSKHFYQAFEKGFLQQLPTADKWGPLTLRREARAHGFSQRAARYLFTHNDTIFNGRSPLPVCVLPLSPGQQWMSLVYQLFAGSFYVSRMDRAVGHYLCDYACGHRFTIHLRTDRDPCLPRDTDILETDMAAVKNGFCLGCRRARYLQHFDAMIKKYCFRYNYSGADQPYAVMGRAIPHASCLVFGRCQSVLCSCHPEFTTTLRPKADPLRGVDDYYTPEDCGHTSNPLFHPFDTADSDSARKRKRAKHVCHVERPLPGTGSHRYPTNTSLEFDNFHNTVNGLLCGRCKQHHSRLLFDPRDTGCRYWPTAPPYSAYTSKQDRRRTCLLATANVDKYLDGVEGARTKIISLRVFQHTPGTRLLRAHVARHLRTLLASDACTAPASDFNTSICAHMRCGGSSLFDKLMLPFEPGVCACFDFDHVHYHGMHGMNANHTMHTVPVAGHGEQNHAHHTRTTGGDDCRHSHWNGFFRRNHKLMRIVRETTFRHAAPVHVPDDDPSVPVYSDDEDDVVCDNDANKCCRCLAVADPARQGVFSVDAHAKDEFLCGTVAPVEYPHQYKCMHCVTYYSWVRDRDDPAWVLLRCARYLDAHQHRQRGLWGYLASIDPARLLAADNQQRRDLKYVTWCDQSGDGRIDGTPTSDNFRSRCRTTAHWYKLAERYATDGCSQTRYNWLRKMRHAAESAQTNAGGVVEEEEDEEEDEDEEDEDEDGDVVGDEDKGYEAGDEAGDEADDDDEDDDEDEPQTEKQAITLYANTRLYGLDFSPAEMDEITQELMKDAGMFDEWKG